MEAIPKEVIEMAEDFFSRFSDEEKEKMLREYFKEQIYIAAQCHIWMRSITDKKILRNIESLYLVIVRSYKYYGIKLPEISIDTFRATYENYCEENNHHTKKGLNSLESFIEVTEGMNQNDLIIHTLLKLHGTDDNQVQYKSPEDMGASIAIVIMLLLLLNNEMKKHISDEIN